MPRESAARARNHSNLVHIHKPPIDCDIIIASCTSRIHIQLVYVYHMFELAMNAHILFMLVIWAATQSTRHTRGGKANPDLSERQLMLNYGLYQAVSGSCIQSVMVNPRIQLACYALPHHVKAAARLFISFFDISMRTFREACKEIDGVSAIYAFTKAAKGLKSIQKLLPKHDTNNIINGYLSLYIARQVKKCSGCQGFWRCRRVPCHSGSSKALPPF